MPKNKNVMPLLKYSLCITSVWEQPKFSKFFWHMWLGWYHMNPIHLDFLYVDASTWWHRILVSWEFAMSLVWVLKFSLSLLPYSLILGITERHSSTHSIPLTICSNEICAKWYLTYIHPNKLSSLGLMLNWKCAKDSVYHYFSIGSCRQWLI